MIEHKQHLSCLRWRNQYLVWVFLLCIAVFTLPSFAQNLVQTAPLSSTDPLTADHSTVPTTASTTKQSVTRPNTLSPSALSTPISTQLKTLTETSHSKNAIIAIIIDDLGNLKQRDMRAIQLPGDVTLSFLPQTPYARPLAQLAHQLNKEIMLHLPMQAIQNKLLGPGGFTLDMDATELVQQLQRNLASVPHVVGVNNHMGSLLTQQPSHMQWLMQGLKKRNNLYFVDSYTTKTSIAQKTAAENWIPNARRDVFLDHDRDPDVIRFHLRRLIKKAKKNGSALAIGHPFPETMAILEQAIPKLHEQGITLVPVSQLLQYPESQRLRQAAKQHPNKILENIINKTSQKVSRVKKATYPVATTQATQLVQQH